LRGKRGKKSENKDKTRESKAKLLPRSQREQGLEKGQFYSFGQSKKSKTAKVVSNVILY
jgi:hypothetical protein